MSGYGITLDFSRDGASPALAAVRTFLSPSRLNQLVGRSATNVYRQHLFGLNNTRPNALGGQRTNFYAQAARATHFDVAGDIGVIISINQVGIAQRFFGGTIKPKTAKFLTIPARAEAHGKRAGEFNDLIVLFGKNGPYALARAVSTAISVGRRGADGTRRVASRGQQGGEIMFWLVKEATQAADPTVLPDKATVFEQVNADLRKQLELEISRAGGAKS